MIRRAVRELARNVNALIVLVGFVMLECGVAVQWSRSVASIVGGCLLLAVGSWPYLMASMTRKP